MFVLSSVSKSCEQRLFVVHEIYTNDYLFLAVAQAAILMNWGFSRNRLYIPAVGPMNLVLCIYMYKVLWRLNVSDLFICWVIAAVCSATVVQSECSRWLNACMLCEGVLEHERVRHSCNWIKYIPWIVLWAPCGCHSIFIDRKWLDSYKMPNALYHDISSRIERGARVWTTS